MKYTEVSSLIKKEMLLTIEFFHLIFIDMTTKTIYLHLFFLFTCMVYAQESTTVLFNTKGEMFAPLQNKNANTNKVATLRADVTLKHSKFSVLLIDYNKNNSFIDYRGCCKNIGSDGILFLAYQEKKINIPFYRRRFLLKNYPFAFNGKTYLLKNFRQNKDGNYIADLTKKTVTAETIFKTKNKVIIDSLPDIVLHNYYNNKEVRLRNKQNKNRKLLMQVFSLSDFVNYLALDLKKDKLLKKYFNHLDLVNIVIIKNKSVHSYLLNKYNRNKKEFLTLKVSEKDKILQLGNNMANGEESTFLFDEKAKVIFTDLDNFLAIKKQEEDKKEN